MSVFRHGYGLLYIFVIEIYSSYVMQLLLKLRFSFLPWPTPRHWQRGAAKDETLRQKTKEMISIFPLSTFHLYVEAGIEFNFSEFIFIFDLVLGFYCSGQKSRKNTEIKSCWHLIFFNERPQYWDSSLA